MALSISSIDNVAEDTPVVSRGYAWLVFALTAGLMLSDYMSRQVLNAVFPSLKAEWALSDSQLGALVSIVALTVGLMSFPISLFADRWGRVKSATAMAIVWGVATIACGLSGNFMAMLLARAVVGLGEAGYGGTGGAILLSVFPRRLHSTVLSAFIATAMFGSVLGVALGGILADHYGWRMAFMAVGAGGLLLALIYPLVVREPARSTKQTPVKRMPLKAVMRELLTTPTAQWTYLASGLQMFIHGTVVAWTPSYLNRVHHMDMTQAATGAGLLVLVAGIGMIGGGALVDRLSRNDERNKLRIPMFYVLISALILLVAFSLPPSQLQLILIGVGLFVGAGFAGASGAAISDVINPAIHASAVATLVLANNIIGLAPGPFITGVLADAFGLQVAMALVPLVSFGSAFAFLKASRHYRNDLARRQQVESCA
ncbi:MFS transporter [Pseudomonas fluorescens]|uniref:MFS transporter n=1 Tax=Pseudomonas fluorescens TaxID=294 RepID=UPI00123F875F|nr:MFS transporter [Pseudomonas fluorescens]VVM78225.1 putative L-galactonate transporter [Pseudomonas fluorescens]